MSKSSASSSDAALRAVEVRLREVMLAFPHVTEEFPWGHRTAKVRGKMFAVLVLDEQGLTVTIKLPQSHEAALMLPFAEPTGYGLGKSGWVTARFAPGEVAPVELLSLWVHESFRAVAPKAVLDAVDGGKPPRSSQVKKSTPARKKAVSVGKKPTSAAKKVAPAAKKSPPAARKTVAKKAAPGVKKPRTARRATASRSKQS
ncbi:MmcQ/YjbR family DNA-binding protein [Myxococcus sp. CA033]|uniref:MmcQ/YjbR family DNA-binding protein n=1 Tax=Myxococcus sp. CA033 TaxID=2741516 RepID=UPI00157A991E|nr:MmcQ/YjbR family DNA-binding protein [Myxococcus sp. CA033]NTX34445.1 MmcQ/YjbR family DNA-binding protein [Myxococcus sp. CA033]